MRKPLRQFCKEEGISERKAYNERYAGRLVFTKVGSGVFIDDEDAERWRSLAPKIGRVGDVALQAAEQALKTLGKAIQSGDVDHASAVRRLRSAATAAGLNTERASI